MIVHFLVNKMRIHFHERIKFWTYNINEWPRLNLNKTNWSFMIYIVKIKSPYLTSYLCPCVPAQNRMLRSKPPFRLILLSTI